MQEMDPDEKERNKMPTPIIEQFCKENKQKPRKNKRKNNRRNNCNNGLLSYKLVNLNQWLIDLYIHAL